MGLVQFVLDAGRKLFGGADAAAAPADPAVHSKRATALEGAVAQLGLPVDGLKIKVVGDTAHVRAKVPTQEVREKLVLAIGNTAGIGQVDDDGIEVTAPQDASVFYTVQKGDTLSKIAQQHYGSAAKYMAIFEANRPMLEDPDRIYPGQVLRIPRS